MESGQNMLCRPRIFVTDYGPALDAPKRVPPNRPTPHVRLALSAPLAYNATVVRGISLFALLVCGAVFLCPAVGKPLPLADKPASSCCATNLAPHCPRDDAPASPDEPAATCLAGCSALILALVTSDAALSFIPVRTTFPPLAEIISSRPDRPPVPPPRA